MKSTRSSFRRLIAALCPAALAVACTAAGLEDPGPLGTRCEADTDCAVFGACFEGRCVLRCDHVRRADCLNGDECGEDDLCHPRSLSSGGGSSSSGGSSGGFDSGTNPAGCSAAGTVLRSDLPADARSLVVDAETVWLQGTITDNLGVATAGLFAGARDGSGGVRRISDPIGWLLRSGSWLYGAGDNGNLFRLPAPPPDPAPAPAFVRRVASVFATPSRLFVLQDGSAPDGGSAAPGLYRMDPSTGALGTRLDTGEIERVARTSTDVYWVGTGGRIWKAPIDSGAAVDTGVAFPSNLAAPYGFGARGATVYFASPNGSLVGIDTSTPEGTQSVVHGPLSDPAYQRYTVDGDDAFYLEQTDTSGCIPVKRIDLETGAEQAAATIPSMQQIIQIEAGVAYTIESTTGRSTLRAVRLK